MRPMLQSAGESGIVHIESERTPCPGANGTQYRFTEAWPSHCTPKTATQRPTQVCPSPAPTQSMAMQLSTTWNGALLSSSKSTKNVLCTSCSNSSKPRVTPSVFALTNASISAPHRRWHMDVVPHTRK
eukprot:3460107-Rhodomonas_salina.1